MCKAIDDEYQWTTVSGMQLDCTAQWRKQEGAGSPGLLHVAHNEMLARSRAVSYSDP